MRIAERLGVTARFSLRVNPDVDARHAPLHQHRSARSQVRHRYRGGAGRVSSRPELPESARGGRDCHIGSQILDYSSDSGSRGKVLASDRAAAGGRAWDRPCRSRRRPRHCLPGRQTTRPIHADFVGGGPRCRSAAHGLTVMIEPGRSIVGPAGVLLTRVLYRKTNAVEGVRGGGCGDERSDSPGALQGAS